MSDSVESQSSPVLFSLSDARVGITLLGLFGQEPYGNVPTTLACVPASELEPLLCLPRGFVNPHQRTSRC